MSENFDTVAGLGAAWALVVTAEHKAINLAVRVLGADFPEQGGVFFDVSGKVHDEVKALQDDFVQAFAGSVEERQAFISSYCEKMPEQIESLYQVTLALGRSLRDFTGTDESQHREAVEIIASLEAMRPEEAAAYSEAVRPVTRKASDRNLRPKSM